MILGTSRRWWIAAAVPLLIGIGLFATGYGGTLGTAVGVLLLLLAMGLFAAAPMRYGRGAPSKAAPAAEPPPAPVEPATPVVRPTIDARDAADV